MKNLLKSSFGIFFALFMGVQGIVLEHITEETVFHTESNELSELGEVTVSDYTKSLPIIFEAEKVADQAQISIPSRDFITPFLTQLFHLEKAIKLKLHLSTLVVLIFDIKDIIFPTHFFL